MAIAFNLPSEETATEESYARLNSLLAELYEVLCHILVSNNRREGQPESGESSNPSSVPLESNRPEPRPRVRPQSDSTFDRAGSSTLPDLVTEAPIPPPRRRNRSAVNPDQIHEFPSNLNIDYDADDEVFDSPEDNNRVPRDENIFRDPRRPRIGRRFGYRVASEKHWQDKGGTGDVDEADGLIRNFQRVGVSGSEDKSTDLGSDSTDGASASSSKMGSTSSEGSILSSIIPDKFSGSIWTAVLVMVGWKLLANKR